jgi:hypothetical protein
VSSAALTGVEGLVRGVDGGWELSFRFEIRFPDGSVEVWSEADHWVRLGTAELTRTALDLTVDAAITDIERDLERHDLTMELRAAPAWRPVDPAAESALAAAGV